VDIVSFSTTINHPPSPYPHRIAVSGSASRKVALGCMALFGPASHRRMEHGLVSCASVFLHMAWPCLVLCCGWLWNVALPSPVRGCMWVGWGGVVYILNPHSHHIFSTCIHNVYSQPAFQPYSLHMYSRTFFQQSLLTSRVLSK
jgi:hypothetical protein